MRTILEIFSNDIKSAGRHFFALAIIAAVAVLPALYAWVNIYANGNPYANTGEIKIALASDDPGITLEDGTSVNLSDEVFDEMRNSDKIGWQFPGSPEEAIEGVRSGEYYAAIIFEDNFTNNMYNFEEALIDDKAPLVYYENGKKNAVASKICETAASNLRETIKTKYLETVFGTVLDDTNELADRLSEGNAAEVLIRQLETVRDSLYAYDGAVDAFEANSSELQSGLNSARSSLSGSRASARKSQAKAKADLKQAEKSVKVLNKALHEREAIIGKEIEDLIAVLKKLRNSGLSDSEREALEKEAALAADIVKADLEDLAAIFGDSQEAAAIRTVSLTLDNMIKDAEAVKNGISDPETAMTVAAALKKLSEEPLSSAIDAMISDMESMLEKLGPMASDISAMLDDIDPVIDSAGATASAMDESLVQMRRVFRASADDLDRAIREVRAAKGDDRIELLTRILGGDPEKYAEFFSSLVDVEVEEVYSVASYGAAMAPFYSVLALWVGGVILVSLLKTHIDRKKYPDASEAEAFFGRFLLFFLIGQLQAAVIVAGDIFLLGCKPVCPWLMWVCASVTSFVFVLLIYALSLSFGDIGKAMVVVVMVLQIAGSSGSYPIEILPPVFGKIYRFFPFPYAINAMREALCGMYGADMWKYLGELLLFGVMALAIGLLVRKPFIGMNSFVSEKLEETEVL